MIASSKSCACMLEYIPALIACSDNNSLCFWFYVLAHFSWQKNPGACVTHCSFGYVSMRGLLWRKESGLKSDALVLYFFQWLSELRMPPCSLSARVYIYIYASNGICPCPARFPFGSQPKCRNRQFLPIGYWDYINRDKKISRFWQGWATGIQSHTK